MNSWIDAKRVVAAEPGPRDSFVVVLADGKRIETATVDRYEEVLIRLQRLARQTDLAVKVLPMTAREYIAFVGVTGAHPMGTPQAEAELRKVTVDTLRAAMVEAPDLSTRTEARDALKAMGQVA